MNDIKLVKIEKYDRYSDVTICPTAVGRPTAKERNAARECCSDVRQMKNDIKAAHRFKRVLAANFRTDDMVVTLTYNAEHLPKTPEIANNKRLKPFINRMRKEYRELDETFKYAYVTEGYHGDHRLHHHIILPNIPELRELVEQCWGKNGEVTELSRLGTKGVEGWAMYLTKEPRKTGRRYVGQRMWTTSLNMSKPVVSTYEVPDDYTYAPPFGAVILDNKTSTCGWFSAQYISFYEPEYST